MRRLSSTERDMLRAVDISEVKRNSAHGKPVASALLDILADYGCRFPWSATDAIPLVIFLDEVQAERDILRAEVVRLLNLVPVQTFESEQVDTDRLARQARCSHPTKARNLPSPSGPVFCMICGKRPV